jgi:hypothetical protein
MCLSSGPTVGVFTVWIIIQGNKKIYESARKLLCMRARMGSWDRCLVVLHLLALVSIFFPSIQIPFFGSSPLEHQWDMCCAVQRASEQSGGNDKSYVYYVSIEVDRKC